MVKVSIVIPVFNVEKYLSTCISSAINQTLKDIEIICIDDGSTDSSGEILDEFAKKDSRIRVIHKCNEGYGKAVNTGMDAAAGEYFAILESDDFVSPEMYETLYDTAKKYSLDIIKADYASFLEKNGEIVLTEKKIAKDGMYNRVITVKDELSDVVQNAGLYTWSGIYNLAFLRKRGIKHNETPGASYQDNGFWFITITSAETVFFLDKSFYRLRRDNPNSSVFSKAKVFCIRDEYDFIYDWLKRNSDSFEDLLPNYWAARHKSYIYNLFRIDSQYRKEFLKHFSATIEKSKKYLDYSLFSDRSKKIIQAIQLDPSERNIYLKGEFMISENNRSGARRLFLKIARKLFFMVNKNRVAKLVSSSRTKRLA